MITLPPECYYIIFNNLQNSYKNLFSCALVNRQWCRIIIPILWSEPGHNFKDLSLIRILLLTLNTEEQTLLIPYKITLPSHPKPLFDYTNYITSISGDLYDGVKYLLPPYGRYEVGREPETTIKSCLIAMFLRTSKNLKRLYVDEIICNKKIFESLYEKTTVTSIDLYLTYNISNDFKSKAIDKLVKILCKNSTLTSLNLKSIQLGTNEVKALLEVLYKNTVLKSLGLNDRKIGTEEFKMLAKFLCENTTLTSLNLSGIGGHWLYYGSRPEVGKAFADVLCRNATLTALNLGNNKIGLVGVKALTDALCKNNTLISLNLNGNKLTSRGGKALADALCKNTSLKDLSIQRNGLGLEGGKALADALCKNTTLTSLNLNCNGLRSEGGKALIVALCKNSTLTSLSLGKNYLGPEIGKMLADALCKNNTLTSLNLHWNKLGSEGGKALTDALCKNTTLTFLNLRDNNINFVIKSNNQNIEILQ